MENLYKKINKAGMGVCPNPMLHEVKSQSDVHWSEGYKIPVDAWYLPNTGDLYLVAMYKDGSNTYLHRREYFESLNGGGNHNIREESLFLVVNVSRIHENCPECGAMSVTSQYDGGVEGWGNICYRCAECDTPMGEVLCDKDGKPILTNVDKLGTI